MLFGIVATVALCSSFAPQPVWHLIAPAVAVALAALPGLAVLGGRGPLAVARFEWTQDGAWRLTRPDGRAETGRLTSATAALGPWLLLAWTVGQRRWGLLSHRYALIGVADAEPGAFRVLTGRLRLLGSRDCGASGAVAP